MTMEPKPVDTKKIDEEVFIQTYQECHDFLNDLILRLHKKGDMETLMAVIKFDHMKDMLRVAETNFIESNIQNKEDRQ